MQLLKDQPGRATTWLFVVNAVLHLSDITVGSETWWCVDRRCKTGDNAFIYKPLKGVILRLQVLGVSMKSEMFCESFHMATARVKLLDVFDPPVTARDLKSSPRIRVENFVRGNFQGTSFAVVSDEVPNEIVSIARRLKAERVSAKSDAKDKRTQK
jgi:hypothetical protein